MSEPRKATLEDAKKGQYFSNPAAFAISGHTFAADRLMRCESVRKAGAGVSIKVSMLNDGGDLMHLTLPNVNGLVIREKPEMPLDIKANIKVFEEMSQETTALTGTITYQGETLHVSCGGHGDGVLVRGNQATIKTLGAALDEYLVQAGVPPEGMDNPYRDSIEHLVNYLAYTGAWETYAECEKRSAALFQAMLAPRAESDTPSPT